MPLTFILGSVLTLCPPPSNPCPQRAVKAELGREGSLGGDETLCRCYICRHMRAFTG